MKIDLHLTQVSKPKNCACQLLYSDEHTIRPEVMLTQDRFDALWKFVEGDWQNKKIAEVECDGINKEGLPINPKLVNIRMWDLH